MSVGMCCLRPFLFFVCWVLCATKTRTTAASLQQLHRETIVGGTPAAIDAYLAYGVYGDFDDNSFCGGVLIHPDIFLTAAHCFLDVSEESILDLRVYFGANRLNRNDADEVRTVVDYREHPDYRTLDGVGEFHDFFVLVLDGPVTVAEPLEYDTTDGDDNNSLEDFTILGFGLTSTDGEVSPILLQATVTPVDFSECDEAYLDDLEPQQHICATAPGVDSCQNDSGGPLLHDSVVVGIVSFGEMCGSFVPGVYARVSGAKEFLHTAICDLSAVPAPECTSAAVSSAGYYWAMVLSILVKFAL